MIAKDKKRLQPPCSGERGGFPGLEMSLSLSVTGADDCCPMIYLK